jgi:hypothetical protein
MHCRIAERAIEFVFESQLFAVSVSCVDPPLPGRVDQRLAIVDSDQRGTVGSKFLRQVAVATADIQYPLAAPRVEHLYDLVGKMADEACVLLVELRAPRLDL